MSSPGIYLQWLTKAHTVTQVGFCASFGAGLLLIFLNFMGAQSLFGQYKYITRVFTVLGMVFTALGMVVNPNTHNFNTGTLLFTNAQPFGVIDTEFGQKFLVSYPSLYSSLLALLATQFLYRYWTVFDVKKLRFFNGGYSLVWLIFCSVFGFFTALDILVFFEMDRASTEYFRKEMLYGYNLNISELPAFGILAYNPLDGSASWWHLMGVWKLFLVFGILYAIMIYCGWSLYSQMDEKIQNFSDTLKKLHWQIFRVIVLQLTAFTLLILLPTIFIFLLPLFKLEISLPTGALLCCSTLYPSITSIMLMIVVSQYNNTFRETWNNTFSCGRAATGHNSPAAPIPSPDHEILAINCTPMMNYRNFPTAHI